MAYRSTRPVKFDPDEDYVVARPLTLNGVTLKPGAPFDKSCVVPLRLRQLYWAKQIAFAPRLELRLLAPGEKLEDTSTSGRPIGLTVEHVGHGKYCVMQGGVRIGDLKDKAGAEADMAMLAA